jgi:hypothetical protein
MLSLPHKILEAEYALMTLEERKLLIEVFRVMAANAIAAMTPQELQRAQARMMGIAVTSPSAN